MERVFYLVLGPESSGTRIVAWVINSAYEFKGGGYSTEPDYGWKSDWERGYEVASNRRLLTRSIPIGTYPHKDFVDIESICAKFMVEGYTVIPIVLYRNIKYLIQSQIATGHVPNKNVAINFISKAYDHIFKSLENLGLAPFHIHYGMFVTNENYRKRILKELKLGESNIELYDGNAKYRRY